MRLIDRSQPSPETVVWIHSTMKCQSFWIPVQAGCCLEPISLKAFPDGITNYFYATKWLAT